MVNFNSRFVQLVVILGLVLVVNFNQLVAIFVVIFIVNFMHTKHYKYKAIFATFMKSQNRYLLVNSTIQLRQEYSKKGCLYNGETVRCLCIRKGQ